MVIIVVLSEININFCGYSVVLKWLISGRQHQLILFEVTFIQLFMSMLRDNADATAAESEKLLLDVYVVCCAETALQSYMPPYTCCGITSPLVAGNGRTLVVRASTICSS